MLFQDVPTSLPQVQESATLEPPVWATIQFCSHQTPEQEADGC